MQQTNSNTADTDAVIGKWEGRPGNLIMILHEIQNMYGYVPRDVSLRLSERLDIPLARIYEVLTFYNYFKLNPPGKNTIAVCMGTACYLKGAPGILEEIGRLLGIKPGETTHDGQFHLEQVRCLGCCGLAPVMTINGKVYGKVKKDSIVTIVSEFTKEEKVHGPLQ
jgi:NADH-quinone oxidoreductase subunit E